ncbi:kinase-like domain-containing protein [Thelephora terrestris]|uniref:Kinase-like domain-containing protein n=1 Tax=Thelephora terrestris TaxID=56493 RepID=A0A9P6LB69_9AGAM|nr:kinase-like domain-containing protein [Thelephora terrestris]
MTTRTRKSQMSVLDDRIDILDKNAAEPSPIKKVFSTVSAILALVRDKLITNKDFVRLSDYCFNVCEVLKTAIKEENADDLSEPVQIALEDLARNICEIEQTLRRRAIMPSIGYDKGKIEGHKLVIQEILNALSASSPHDDIGECAPQSPPRPLHPRAVGISSSSLSSLVEAVFAWEDAGDAIHRLSRDDAQTFIDVIDEALDRPDLSPLARKECLRPLYRTCGRHAILPRTLKIPICYDRTSDALYSGGYADVWRGEYHGQDVAVKVIRTYSNSDLRKIIGRFCKEVVTWRTLHHPNVLPLIGVTMSETKFAMVSGWMANGNINEFVMANPGANRLTLLGGVARGLIYIHSQGMIHGDLKGANILIDQTGQARLADFGLLTIISDPTNLLSSSSYTQGGTARWMSPELIAPEDFGMKTSRPTEFSDCYSLGMVIYETISGNLPFHEDTDLTVFVKVLKGERPRREAGFTTSLWEMLERCWMPQPNHRPSVEDVLRCLETCSSLSASSSLGMDTGMANNSSDGLAPTLDERGGRSPSERNARSNNGSPEPEFGWNFSSSPDKLASPPIPPTSPSSLVSHGPPSANVEYYWPRKSRTGMTNRPPPVSHALLALPC